MRLDIAWLLKYTHNKKKGCKHLSSQNKPQFPGSLPKRKSEHKTGEVYKKLEYKVEAREAPRWLDFAHRTL